MVTRASAEVSALTGAVRAATAWENDFAWLIQQPPGALVQYFGMDEIDEQQPIGRPLKRKMTIRFRVVTVARNLRTEGTGRATVGMHSILSDLRDAFQGYELAGAARPLILDYEGEILDELLRQLLCWEQHYRAAVWVDEVP